MTEDNTAADTTQASSRATSPVPGTPSHSPPSTKFTSDDMVTLLVGSKKKKLLVHAHRLTNSSEFFKAALKKEWKEGQTHVVKLPEENVVNTTRYLEFIYEGRLCSSDIKDYEGLKAADCYVALCQMYTFGERVCDVSLRNSTINELIRLISLRADDRSYWAPNWYTAAEVYRATTVGSPIRRFLVDVLVTYSNPDWLDAEHEDERTELLVDTLKEFTKKARDYQNPVDFRLKTLKAEDYLI